MRINFTGRTVICLSAMTPAGVDLGKFEQALDLGRPKAQVIEAQFLFADYGKVKLVVTPDGRLQLELLPGAGRDLCRRAALEIVRQARPSGMRGIGFNGLTRLEVDESDADPLKVLFRDDVIAERLEVPVARRGLKLVYPLDDARITLDVIPDDDDPLAWVASINRHYVEVPDQTAMEGVVSWFAALDNEMAALVRRLLRDTSSGAENAA